MAEEKKKGFLEKKWESMATKNKIIVISVIAVVLLIGVLSEEESPENIERKRLLKEENAAIAEAKALSERRNSAQMYLAKTMEENFLSKGFNVEVVAGDGDVIFDCSKSPLPKVAAYNLRKALQENKEVQSSWKKLGAKKYIIRYGGMFDYYEVFLR